MNDMTPTITTWIIIWTLFIWLIWDIYLYANNKETISRKLRNWNKHIMAVSNILFFLMGHWFW